MSGQQPSASMLDQILQSELSSQYDNMYQEQQAQLAQQQEAQRVNEFNESMKMQDANRIASTATGLIGSAAQLGGMYKLSGSHALGNAGGAVKEFFAPQTGGAAKEFNDAVNSLAPQTGRAAKEFNDAVNSLAPQTGQELSPLGTGTPSAIAPPEGLVVEGGKEAGAGMLAGAGEAIGGTIGGVAEMAGVEGAMQTGGAIGSAIGSGLSYAAPYAAVANAADRFIVRPLLNPDDTGKFIEDVFNPLGAIEDIKTVLCTELARQGKLEQEILYDERIYINRNISNEEYIGYRILVDPLVRLMKVSELFTNIMRIPIRAFAYEMASRVNKEVKGNLLGKLILIVGLPLCHLVYKMRPLRAFAYKMAGIGVQS